MESTNLIISVWVVLLAGRMLGRAPGYLGPFITAVCEKINCLHFAIVGSEQCTQIRSRHLSDPRLEDSDEPSPAGSVTTGQGLFWAMSSPGKHLLITGIERAAIPGDLDFIITDRAPRNSLAAPYDRSDEPHCGHAAGLIGAITGRIGGTFAESSPVNRVHPARTPSGTTSERRPKVLTSYGCSAGRRHGGPIERQGSAAT